MTKIISIVAISENYVIANDDGIPWDIPEDSKHYKSTVKDHITISGRKTFESGHKGATGEHQIVLTNNKNWDSKYSNVHTVHNIEKSKELAKDLADEDQNIYVIGGESIYREFLNAYDEMIISHIEGEYNGTVYYPRFNIDNWKISKDEEYDDFKIVWYQREDS